MRKREQGREKQTIFTKLIHKSRQTFAEIYVEYKIYPKHEVIEKKINNKFRSI